MRIGRTIPPAAAPIYPKDIVSGFKGIIRGNSEFERFVTDIREYFGVKYCFLLSSGRAALAVILQALKKMHPHRDEVLIPAFTCFSVPSAIVRAGLKVKLCDINPETLDFDFIKLSRVLSRSCNPKSTESNRLLSVIAVHPFGIPSDIHRLKKIINDHEVTIVEDAAQSMGAEQNGNKLGTFGDVSFFSLGRGKAISAVAGGVILTNRDDIACNLKKIIQGLPYCSLFEVLRLIGYAISLAIFIDPLFFWIPRAIPFLRLGETLYDPDFKMRKISSFQAGLARDWRGRIKSFRNARAEHSRFWARVTEQDRFSNFVKQDRVLPDLIRFPVRVEDESLRKRILDDSDKRGLGIVPGYPDSIDGIQELKRSFEGEDFPAARRLARQLITLPVHPIVSRKDREKIHRLILG